MNLLGKHNQKRILALVLGRGLKRRTMPIHISLIKRPRLNSGDDSSGGITTAVGKLVSPRGNDIFESDMTLSLMSLWNILKPIPLLMGQTTLKPNVRR